MPSFTQKNFTIPEDKRKIIEENYPQITIAEIARRIKYSHNTVKNNMRLMGLVKTKPSTIKKDKVKRGYFNEIEFAKAYKF